MFPVLWDEPAPPRTAPPRTARAPRSHRNVLHGPGRVVLGLAGLIGDRGADRSGSFERSVEVVDGSMGRWGVGMERDMGLKMGRWEGFGNGFAFFLEESGVL